MQRQFVVACALIHLQPRIVVHLLLKAADSQPEFDSQGRSISASRFFGQVVVHGDIYPFTDGEPDGGEP